MESGPADTPDPQALFRWHRPTVVLVLAFKVLVLVFGWWAAGWTLKPGRARPDLLVSWVQWDAHHYLAIAEHGYGTDEAARPRIVFFPLFPYTVALVARATRDFVTAGFLAATVFSILGMLAFREMARRYTDDATADRAVWFLLVAPMSFILHLPYTEALFIACAAGSLAAARTGTWAAAGMLGMLACMARPNGLALVPALAVEAWLRLRERGRVERDAAWIALAPAGFGVYLALNAAVFGDPLAFVRVREETFSLIKAMPWETLIHVAGSIPDAWHEAGVRSLVEMQEPFFLLIAIGATAWACFALRPTLAVWAAGNLWIMMSTQFVLGVPRYLLALFPLYLLMGRATERSATWKLLSAASLMLLGVYAARWPTGLWVH